MPTQQIPQRHVSRRQATRTLLLVPILIALLAGGGPRRTNAWKISSAVQTPGVQSSSRSSPDEVWRELDEQFLRQMDRIRRASPKAYRTVSLNRSALFDILTRAPMEFTDSAKSKDVRLSLPVADGTFQQFKIEESPIMEPELAQRHPEIKTYKGQGLDD